MIQSPTDLQSHITGSVQQALKRKSTQLNKPITAKKMEMSKTLENNFKFQQFQDLLKQDDDYFEKEELIEKMKKQVGRCGSFYLRLKKKYID